MEKGGERGRGRSQQPPARVASLRSAACRSSSAFRAFVRSLPLWRPVGGPTLSRPLAPLAVHCGSIRQTATILSMDKDCLRTGDKATVHFRFIKTPEYLHIDQRLVFREGRTKAVGTITKVWLGRPRLPPADTRGHSASRP